MFLANKIQYSTYIFQGKLNTRCDFLEISYLLNIYVLAIGKSLSIVWESALAKTWESA